MTMLTIDGLEKWYVNTVKLKHAFAGTTPPDPIPLPSVTNVDGLLEGLVTESENAFVAAAEYAGKSHGEVDAYKIQLPSKIYRWYGMKKVGGRTIVFNQVASLAAGTNTTNGVTFTFSANGTTVTNGTSEADIDLTKQPSYIYISGHYYMVKGAPHGAADDTYFINMNEGHVHYDGLIFKSITSAKKYLHFVIKAGIDVTGLTWKLQIFDLTVMFGAGNEPKTAAEFNAIFPGDYYARNSGELINAGVTDVVSKDADNNVLETITIPSAVKSLTGYGISCPGKYNYIDFEAKKFVQNVGSRAYAEGDESDATVITDGTTTHYPLTTPVETSITIADDIAHTDGGSITFENNLGADYLVPVPVDVRYIG
jgi:hypothetical protein